MRRFPAGTTKRTLFNGALRVLFNEALRALFNEALRALADGPTGSPTPVIFGAFDHVPVRMLPNFDDPLPGFSIPRKVHEAPAGHLRVPGRQP